jgi:two-component system, cell cycle response regulator CpdR
MSANILIVEDEDGLRTGLARLLRDRGFAVDEAADGEEGLACLNASEYAVVVCDVAMPIMNGLEMLKAAGDRLGAARVLLLSAYGIADAPVSIAARLTKTLPKPVAHAKVADAVASLLAA